ncbi:MAG: hypothetical protein NTY44_13970, partial [Deltaproteobacteria bacterium]|nr:hypothetical protein [Deltaproteobacteria bacterium]
QSFLNHLSDLLSFHGESSFPRVILHRDREVAPIGRGLHNGKFRGVKKKTAFASAKGSTKIAENQKNWLTGLILLNMKAESSMFQNQQLTAS